MLLSQDRSVAGVPDLAATRSDAKIAQAHKELHVVQKKFEELDERLADTTQQNDVQQREIQKQLSEVAYAAEDRLLSALANLEQRFSEKLSVKLEEQLGVFRDLSQQQREELEAQQQKLVELEAQRAETLEGRIFALEQELAVERESRSRVESAAQSVKEELAELFVCAEADRAEMNTLKTELAGAKGEIEGLRERMGLRGGYNRGPAAPGGGLASGGTTSTTTSSAAANSRFLATGAGGAAPQNTAQRSLSTSQLAAAGPVEGGGPKSSTSGVKGQTAETYARVLQHNGKLPKAPPRGGVPGGSSPKSPANRRAARDGGVVVVPDEGFESPLHGSGRRVPGEQRRDDDIVEGKGAEGEVL